MDDGKTITFEQALERADPWQRVRLRLNMLELAIAANGYEDESARATQFTLRGELFEEIHAWHRSQVK